MNIPVKIKPPKRVEKVWGYELWIHNDEDYCGKLLVFPKALSNFSMHYHLKKKESWYVQSGKFKFKWFDLENAELQEQFLNEGDSVLIERGLPHQLISLEDNSIIVEVSTEHFDSDSYRLWKNSPETLIDDDTI